MAVSVIEKTAATASTADATVAAAGTHRQHPRPVGHSPVGPLSRQAAA